MFEFQDIEFARQQVIAIAAERVAHIPADAKANALAWINVALEKWKLEQAAPDGTIAVKRWPFGGLPGGLLLIEMASGKWDEPIHKPAADLKPYECAGPFVKCSSDLFSKLVFEKYPDVINIRDKLHHDIVVALLLERDGMDMPADSVASALRTIWMWVWELGKVYRAQAVKADVAKTEHLANMRLESATARGTTKRANREKWRVLANAIILENAPKRLKRFAVATTIQERLIAEGTPSDEVPAVGTIEDAIKGLFG